jgi:hypothetical protein
MIFNLNTSEKKNWGGGGGKSHSTPPFYVAASNFNSACSIHLIEYPDCNILIYHRGASNFSICVSDDNYLVDVSLDFSIEISLSFKHLIEH